MGGPESSAKGNAPRPVAGRAVQLMATCLCDAFFDDVAAATVAVLEHLGVAVSFPADQTCCGQPAFNAGDWPAARRVASHTAQVFADALPVVVPSGSCARMTSHGALMLFEGQPDGAPVSALATRTWELADFIVNSLGKTTWGGRYTAKVALHRSCHTRGTRSSEAAATLLQSIDGVQLVAFGEGDQCCGFGGSFSVKYPFVSRQMGELKLEHVLGSAPDVLVSGDMGCLMHLDGLARKQRGDHDGLRTLHIAQLLRDAIAPQTASVNQTVKASS